MRIGSIMRISNIIRNISITYILALSMFIACTFTACSSSGGNKWDIGRLNTEMAGESGYVVKKNVYLEDENVGGLTREQLVKRLEKYAERVEKKPRNASIDNKKWTVTKKESEGRRLDINKTAELLLNAGEGQRFEPVIEKVAPELTSDKWKLNIVTLGEYTSPILDKKPGRILNLEIAASAIDYYKVLPGEEFSFNDVVGKRTKMKGYEDAPIFIRTKNGPKKVDELGGGICQISSTLYNAVDKAGLNVTERHVHSKKVYYVPYGKDATVSYGRLDFRFKNNREYPVMIRVKVTKGQVTVKILENRNDKL